MGEKMNDYLKEKTVSKITFDLDKLHIGDKIILKHRNGYFLNKPLELQDWDKETEYVINCISEETIYLKDNKPYTGSIITMDVELIDDIFYSIELI